MDATGNIYCRNSHIVGTFKLKTGEILDPLERSTTAYVKIFGAWLTCRECLSTVKFDGAVTRRRMQRDAEKSLRR